MIDTKDKRNPSIELFRVLCMFGVCLLHALDQGGFADAHRGLDNLLWPSVVGFIFISGYFGMRFRLKSIIRLLGTAFYCFITVSIVSAYIGNNGLNGFIRTFRSCMGFSWFLWMYLGLMMASPLFETLFEVPHDGNRDNSVLVKIFPFLFLVFGWSYAATKVPILKDYIPSIIGFDVFSILTFIGVYLAARCCWYFEVDKRVSCIALSWIAVISGSCCWIGIMHYNSPAGLLFAGSIFLLFKRIKLPNWLEVVSVALAPSMFSVYLVHTNGVVFPFIHKIEKSLIVGYHVNYYVACMIVAVALFILGVIVDVPRRMAKILYVKHLKKVSHYCLPLVLTLGCAIRCVAAQVALLEAEAFSQKGGWVVDQQFVDQMGSPYLLAHGLGVPVADAVTILTNDVGSMTKRMFVRTRDWVSPLGPGRFCVKINGIEGYELGQGVGTWGWIDAGSVTLQHGVNEIRLHDHTGFEGRIDALAFVDESEGFSSNIVEELERLRAIRHVPITTNRFDFVVVGGGYAGMCAAVAASRLGVKTALVQDRPVFGGNASSEVRVGPIGKMGLPPYPRNSDLAFELWEIAKGDGTKMSGGVRPKPDDNRIQRWLEAERNLTLYSSTRAVMAERCGNRVISIVGQHIESGTCICLAARYFADCTGDGWLADRIGAEYRTAPETHEETGEYFAKRRDGGQTGRYGSTNFWLTRWTERPVGFPDCPWALRIEDEDAAIIGNNKSLAGDYPFAAAWNWESGIDRDAIAEGEYIRDYNFRAAYGMWDYLKNRSADKEHYAKAEISWMGYVLGKRSARRIVGDYVLTEQDLVEHRVYGDGVVTTSWYLDMHFPDPRNAARFEEGPFLSTAYDVKGVENVVTNMVGSQVVIEPYPIPYRCFYSKNIENLWMAGKNISCTFVAMSSVRVENTTAQMGQLVGEAISLCHAKGCSPRELGEKYFEELKSLLENPWNETELARKGRYLYQGRTSLWLHVRWYLSKILHWIWTPIGIKISCIIAAILIGGSFVVRWRICCGK